jgi:murein L,D-transpeptidase YcbB/YkuD
MKLGLLRPLASAGLVLTLAWFALPACAHHWTDAVGRPNASAHEALSLLAAARDEGLDPRDYDAAALAQAADRLRAAPEPAPEDIATFEAALSRQLPRYLRHLHTGRVDPRDGGFRVTARHHEHDFAALAETARAEGRVARTAAEMAPPLPAYRPLRSALARYRTLAADTALPQWRATATVRLGESSPALPALRRRLAALGDLPADAPEAGELYDSALADGVSRFQTRHGLQADGVLGPATQAALRVPLAQRVLQIELSLERLRWLPHLDGRFLAVNIPMFRLWAVAPDQPPPMAMNVVVGRALNTRTPVFIAQMKQVVFRPYWNVPRSIVRNELLPLIMRDPAYLQRHDMEIVRGAGDDARAVEPTAANLALLRDGALRVRQRPGPRNALGLVKFVFPNESDVYLHGTPAQGLFARARRDFSHGCVRVEDPVALAEWLLRDQSPWTRERIVAAMAGDRTLHVNLVRPLPVVLYYVTALATPDGAIRFADDLYGHDARLERALAARRPD